MTTKPYNHEGVGDWSTSPPKVTTYKVKPLEELDPRDIPETSVIRSRLIARRRAAGLPDYPPDRTRQTHDNKAKAI